LSLALCRDTFQFHHVTRILCGQHLGPHFQIASIAAKRKPSMLPLPGQRRLTWKIFAFWISSQKLFLPHEFQCFSLLSTRKARCWIDLYQPAAHQVSYLVQLLEHWHDQA
jgi:hypothetical protein